MYIPNANRVDDQAQLVAFMQAHSFATLISTVEGQLFATHLPLVIVTTGDTLLIRGHLARANPQWQELATPREVLVIFQGSHAYISPTLYAKWESVPTWNYQAVHAYGAARLIQDEAGLLAALAELITANEPTYQAHWDGLSDQFRQGMLKGIVAFEITVSRLEGKFKLSQNRPARDQQQVATALAAHKDQTIAATGQAMQQQIHALHG
ncbi:MAG: FMN-binding negative transcriptional regulator [Caldilineaceae bacterium]|nr:FMN-binding negative transcriptional regulator [Caldilineaceae bacterium]